MNAMPHEKRREARLRRAAKRNGLVLKKSRARRPDLNDKGRYALLNDRNVVCLGERFDASLDDIEAYLVERFGRQALGPVSYFEDPREAEED